MVVHPPDQKWYESGSKVTYSCDGGLILTGMRTATCYKGAWMGKNRNCV